MKSIGIITNADRDKDFIYTKLLTKCIMKYGGRPIMTDELSQNIAMGERCGDYDNVINKSDIMVCLGGDGTFLKVGRRIYKKNLPVLGINLGNLGFLTEVDRNDIDQAIEQIFKDNYEIEERMMLEVAICKKGEAPIYDIALNDAVITRRSVSRIIHVKLYVNNIFVDSFPGDGLIISSPTGSTAYSLSAGGPIVDPDNNLLLITPICPHILYSRSFVIKENSLVRAIVDENFHHDAMVALDGEEGYDIKGGDIVEVKKSPYTIKLIKLKDRSFYNILRTKIYYRGESLKKDEIQQTCQNIGVDREISN